MYSAKVVSITVSWWVYGFVNISGLVAWLL